MPEPIATRIKDGVAWPIGGQAEVDWITEGTELGRRTTAAIPPVFAAYATLTDADAGEGLPRVPEVMFPDDRSWLVSSMWDDDWACVGGPEALIRDLLGDPVLAPNARRVDTRQDATPPGDWRG